MSRPYLYYQDCNGSSMQLTIMQGNINNKSISMVKSSESTCWIFVCPGRLVNNQVFHKILLQKGATQLVLGYHSAVARVIQGGACERRRREGGARGVWGYAPQKILKSRGLEMLFQRFPRAICDLRISRIIYFVHCQCTWRVKHLQRQLQHRKPTISVS